MVGREKRRVFLTMILTVFFAMLVSVVSPQLASAAKHPTIAKLPVSKFATVNGARLEYLDWGGKGPPLVFLAGLGATPYIFNDLAPKFTSSFHCFGITRRGFGRSEQTQVGYTLDNLVLDIISVARSLGLRNITLVGHSYGGLEAIRASELDSDLIRRVILLDTAYSTVPSAVPPAEDKLFAAVTGMTQEQKMSSLNAYRDWEKPLLGNLWSSALEADLHETVIVARNGSIAQRTPPRIPIAIVSEREAGSWGLTKIPVPALLIFADHPWTDYLPNLHLDDKTRAEIVKAGAEFSSGRHSQIQAFRHNSPKSRIVILPHTVHHCFIQRQTRVVSEMRKFLAESTTH